MIQAFDFTFEQCWKAIQKKAGGEGVSLASPKKAFQWALEAGWVSLSEEPLWIQIISDRNLSSHTYQESLAVQVSQNILNQHIHLFEKLLQAMKKAERE